MKTCTICKQDLPLEEFGKEKRTKIGLRSGCRKCLAARAKAANAAWEAQNRERRLEIKRNWRKRHPGATKNLPQEKRKAHHAVETALRQGRMVRPGRCERCGKKCRPHGHHRDYAKPLEVIWVCQPCHRLEHLEFDPSFAIRASAPASEEPKR